MRESQIEAYLRNRVRKIGGAAFKFVSPGHAGVPDRLVCLPGGKVIFVELKAPGKKPTLLQLNCHRKLRNLGLQVWVVDSKTEVDRFIEEVMSHEISAT